MTTPFPNIAISQASSRTTNNNLNVVRFGNGYEQRTPMGINYQRDTWSVVWDGLSAAEKNTVVNFIQAVSNGSTILWTTPLDTVQKKFVLDGDWSVQDIGGNVYTVQVSLRQVYDIS